MGSYKRVPSIVWYEDRCWSCGARCNLESHEAFFGSSNRKISCEQGTWVKLCYGCHRGNKGVHLNRELDLELKQFAESRWIAENESTEEEFIKLFGKSYYGIDNANELEEER